MKQFCEGHYLFTANDEGVYPFTHGQPDTIDLTHKPVYPLMHVTPVSRGWDRTTKMRSFNMEIMFATLPHTVGDADNPKQDNIMEALSNTARLCEDLLALISNGSGPFERGWFHFTTAEATPFIDEQKNQLTGHILSLTLNVAYAFDACVVPGTWNISQGGSGGGTSGAIPYLKSIAVTGEDTVQSTIPADTFNFAGSGITITTNAATKTITFTAAGGAIPSVTYDEKADWESLNPVLALNAIGIESETNIWKLGDGAALWNNLEYMRAAALHSPSVTLAVEDAVYPHGLLIVEEDTGLGKMGDGTTSYNSLPYLWVQGPASAVNNRIATFDGISGKLIKDSGVLITDLATDGELAAETAARIAADAVLQADIDTKQDTLVSETNIKTINGVTVLGSGNIVTPDTDTNIANTNLTSTGDRTHDFANNFLKFINATEYRWDKDVTGWTNGQAFMRMYKTGNLNAWNVRVGDPTNSAAIQVNCDETGATAQQLELSAKGNIEVHIDSDTFVRFGTTINSGSQKIRIYGNSNTKYVELKVSDTINANVSYKLPHVIVTDGYLKTDVNGDLSWATVTAGLTANQARRLTSFSF